MAADGQLQRKSSCHEYPDFAATCFFIEKFGDALGLLPLNVKNLRDGFEASSGGMSFSLLLLVFFSELEFTCLLL